MGSMFWRTYNLIRFGIPYPNVMTKPFRKISSEEAKEERKVLKEIDERFEKLFMNKEKDVTFKRKTIF